jgi:hypothetical protein
LQIRHAGSLDIEGLHSGIIKRGRLGVNSLRPPGEEN